MSAVTITRKFSFDAGHRVLGHEGRCRSLHGHTYLAEVTVTAAGLDSLGRVIDFSVLKERVGQWLDDNWDHTTILHPEDPLVEILLERHREDGERLPFLMPAGANPTAENLARELARWAQACLAGTEIRITQVRLWETPNCYADFHALLPRVHEPRDSTRNPQVVWESAP